jgi:hypothetical protein
MNKSNVKKKSSSLEVILYKHKSKDNDGDTGWRFYLSCKLCKNPLHAGSITRLADAFLKIASSHYKLNQKKDKTNIKYKKDKKYKKKTKSYETTLFELKDEAIFDNYLVKHYVS